MATLKINGIVLGTAITVRYDLLFGEGIEIRILLKKKPLALLEIGESGRLIEKITIDHKEDVFVFCNVAIQAINEIICLGQLNYKVYLHASNYKRGGYKNELFGITVKNSVKCCKCSNFVSFYHVYKELRKTIKLEKELALDVIKNDIFIFMCCSCFDKNKLMCYLNRLRSDQNG